MAIVFIVDVLDDEIEEGKGEKRRPCAHLR